MVITDVDLIQVFPKNQERNRGNFAFYGELSLISIYRVATDTELVGYGETRGACRPALRSKASSAAIRSNTWAAI